ncbi:cell division cycle-associated protein 2 [Elephas maximus indicus]|uniref:cell division cycle-associated protein 2 n=1 Tax=Elephas maximus indicus TaxID=99487 RepID=UPI0021164F00|nr:cell division cycle-associated protein 2 [Elephas maximus indicus]XP_049722497.1 cell division cycle-associated protein 2 [Elephas maximus indicus]
MDTSLKGKELLETKDEESAINNAENTSFMLGNGELVTQKHEAEVTPNLCRPDIFKSPLNFSTVTVEQLGITPESFVKNTPGKPSSYLKKSRRRSTIGARGSPETNHLICFIAQQRNLKNAQKSSLAQNSPFQGSPLLYRNVNSLREQISAFQTAFHSIKENEKMADCPEFSEAEREFETADFSIKKDGVSVQQQSGFSAKLPSKRRRISYQSNSDENLTDAEKKGNDLQLFNTDTFPSTARTCSVETSPADLSEKSGPGLSQPGWLVEECLPLSDLAEAPSGIKLADHVEGKGSCGAVSQKKPLEDRLREAVNTDTAPDVRSPVTSVCKKDIASSETFALRSVLKKPSVRLFPESLQEHCDNLCDDGTHPTFISNLRNDCKEQKAEHQENHKVPAFLNVRKRKRVTFGEDLSPEVFDESLPANTPLQKGGTPVRKKDLSGTIPLGLEHSPVPEQLPQPNFDDKGENLENIEPLQVSLAVPSPPSKSSGSETLSGIDTFSSSNNQENTSSYKGGRITRTSNRRNQLTSFAEESVCNVFNTEAQHCKEKKINRRKSQETKHTDRGLPKKNQVLKSGRKKKGKGKNVKKSLYGEREIASKKPLLSPIPEIPEISEMTPSVRRIYSDNFNSNGKLEEVLKPKNLTRRKTLLTQMPEDLHMNQSFDKCDVSEFCNSYIKSSSLLGNVTFDQDSNINTVGVNENENIPKAENQLESENELKTEAGNENSRISCASVTEEYVLSDHPQTGFILQPQEFAAGQNVENRCRVFKISEDLSIKYEKPDDFSVAIEEKPKSSGLMSDSQKEDVFIENIKKTDGQCENLGKKSLENSSEMTCKERKHRRRSMCYPGGQSSHLEKNGSHKNTNRVSSSGGINLENSELYQDLSDAIEQTFKRTNNEIKVRRSTRLQKDLENEGLIWISLPLPSTSCTSQKTKRRTICTFDSRGRESLSSREETVTSKQKPGMPSSSGKENSEGPAANSAHLLGKRRMSFCTSILGNTKNTTQSECYRRRSFLNQKEKSSLND